MEKQLEDFIISNWDKTELGKKYDLIIEDGELISQQYKTEIGPIDILAIDKINKNYVVIELKKNQTSDDTLGQIARYMGWIKENKKDKNVKGIIIAGSYDKKLDYALQMMQNVEVFLYEVSFKLSEFTVKK
jgi:restriction system protein